MNCSISQIDQDDRLDTRVMSLEIDGKNIQTPAKTIESNGAEGGNANQINEISLSVGCDDIVRAMGGANNKYQHLPRYRRADAINIIIPEYKDTTFYSQDGDILPVLESRIHSYSDVVVVPRWKGVLQNRTGELTNDLISMTSKFLEEAKVRNNKMIMGCIPMNVPENIILDLVEFYFRNDISSFVLDYCTCLPLSKKHVVRDIYKKIEKAGWNETSILYSVNVRRTHKTQGIYPADDLLTFVHGVDLIGGLHISGGKRNPSYPEPKVKRFEPSQYVYREVQVLSKDESNRLKLKNRNLQNEATSEVRKAIMENNSAYALLSGKKGAKEYLSDVNQKSLYALEFTL